MIIGVCEGWVERLVGGLFFFGNVTDGKDQFGFGAEARIGNNLEIRAGYLAEQGFGTQDNVTTTAYTGPSGGLTVKLPAGSSGSIIGIDYSYRTTNPFNGTHTIGLKISI